jgi:hypothetical protein
MMPVFLLASIPEDRFPPDPDERQQPPDEPRFSDGPPDQEPPPFDDHAPAGPADDRSPAEFEEHERPVEAPAPLAEDLPETPVAEPVRGASAPSERQPGRAKADWPRRLLWLVVLGIAGFGVYLLLTTRDQVSDVFTQSVIAAATVSPDFETDSPMEVQQFVRSEFGWRVGVPEFRMVELLGVTIAQLPPGIEVPAMLYADYEGRTVVVFTYSYAFFDRFGDQVALPEDSYRQLAQPGNHEVRRVGGSLTIAWRDRDNIFIAVTRLDADELVQGMTMMR